MGAIKKTTRSRIKIEIIRVGYIKSQKTIDGETKPGNEKGKINR